MNWNDNRLIILLAAVAGLIVVLNIVNISLNRPSWQFNRFIDLDTESNFPSWFSSALLAIAAFYAYQCSTAYPRKQSGQRLWKLFALGLLGLSCDEVAMIHESLSIFVNRYLFVHKNWTASLGFFLLVLLILLAIQMRTHLQGSRKALRYLTLGASIYILGGFFLEARNNFLSKNALRSLGNMDTILEESFEMFGTIIMIKGLAEHHRFLLHKNNR